MFHRAVRLATITGLCLIASAAGAESQAPYPELDDADIGHLKNFVALAQQDLDDWRGWEAFNQKDMESYRYQIAFITYTLALQQYHYTPAYRDLYRDTMARLIERMIQKPVWEFWEETSKTSPNHDPDWQGPIEGWRDPVREKNIMYSGHVVHMAALYEMLYRDFRWDEPGALTFRWDENEAFVYDLPKLIEGIHAQMAHNPWGGIECEPNAVFPECNQHPVLAFMLYDHTHDTDFASAREHFKHLFMNAPMVDPDTHEVVAWYYVKQGRVLGDRNPEVGFPQNLLVRPMVTLGFMTFNSPSADGWTGAFMHVWEPELIEAHYPYQRQRHVLPDDSPIGVRISGDIGSPELSVGYFATLAAEVGDNDTADKLLAYADAHYEPQWENGRLRYPRHLEAKEFKTHNLTGKLLALARANRRNGLWALHNQPWNAPDFAHPLLAAVDFPRVVVRQAHWDAGREILTFTLDSGGEDLVQTTFRLVNLDANGSYTLQTDETPIARIALDEPLEANVVRVGPRVVEVTVPLSGRARFELHAARPVQLSAR